MELTVTVTRLRDSEIVFTGTLTEYLAARSGGSYWNYNRYETRFTQ